MRQKNSRMSKDAASRQMAAQNRMNAPLIAP
jgi:hypothetical protein